MSYYHPSGPVPPDQPVPPAATYPSYPPASDAPYPPPPTWAWPAPTPAYGYPPPSPTSSDPLPAAGTEFHQFLRTGRNRWWKGVLVIALLVIGFLLVSLVTGAAAIAFEVATGRIPADSLQTGALTITPLVLLSVNLSAASLIPLSMLLQWAFYGQPVRWLHSVRGFFRFDLLKKMALIVVPIFVVYVLASIFLLPSPPGGPFTAESVGLLVVVVLTTPLQAAGEEYGARGLIARASGSWVAKPRIALILSAVISALLFMLAHGAGDPWLIVYYFFFGVAMSVVVWRTGGLEVATLIHAVYNMLLFGVAIAMGQDLGAGLDRSAGSAGPWILFPMAVLAGITALVCWWAQRHRVDRTYQP